MWTYLKPIFELLAACGHRVRVAAGAENGSALTAISLEHFLALNKVGRKVAAAAGHVLVLRRRKSLGSRHRGRTGDKSHEGSQDRLSEHDGEL
jgi:hypothetical protein